jgi:cell wall-associated NlpC family hydrolase
MSDEQRDLVVKIATTYIGTPYHDNAGVLGHGIDCAHLLTMVYREAGLVKDALVPNYMPQWYLHSDKELYLDIVRRYAREIEASEAGPGDLALYRIGRVYSHGAVIVKWPDGVIHACSMSRKVILSRAFDFELSATRDAIEGKVQFKIFTLW